jgi:predicted transcriptional regulator
MLEYNDSLTIGDVMRYIATEHERTCVLQNNNGKLYGVISQGDLIKAIWNGAELITPINNIINPNPIIINSNSKDPEGDAINLFCQFGALLVPIVDSNRKIVEVLSVRKIISDKYGN